MLESCDNSCWYLDGDNDEGQIVGRWVQSRNTDDSARITGKTNKDKGGQLWKRETDNDF